MDKDERRAWGSVIRDLRKAAGLDQEQLAEQARTSRRTIGSIERGDSVAQRDVLRRVLTVLGVSPEPEIEPDIKAFLAMLTPLLERLTPEQRSTLQPKIVALVVEAFDSRLSVLPTTPVADDNEGSEELPAAAFPEGMEQAEREAIEQAEQP